MSLVSTSFPFHNAGPGDSMNSSFIKDKEAFENIQQIRSHFPNLPGFSKHARPQSTKGQTLNFNNGYMVVKSHPTVPTLFNRPTTAPMTSMAISLPLKEVKDPNDVRGRYSISRQRSDRAKNRVSLPFCPSSKLPKFLEHDRRVLLFNAYYEEDVLQSAIESKRLHICEIYFYVEDGTIEIIQKKQENSGIPQGVFLRRSKVVKPNKTLNDEPSSNPFSPDKYYGIDDLKIGNQVEIYCRKFHIVNCNESTKKYVVESHGWHQVDIVPLPLPRDRFAEANKAKMMRESGVPGLDRKRKMNDLKEVMESMLGKQTSQTDRGMFLAAGQNTLCFDSVWDDRARLYGDVQFFRVFYYLADDSIEILPVHNKNDGRDRFAKLLKRSKLPKDGKLPPGDDASAEYYNWKDLSIGKIINVFGRQMKLSRCDLFTRQYYESNGIKLEENMPLKPREEVKIDIARLIPAHNGFGTEEDSLRSCTGGLDPPPPKRDWAKMKDKLGVILTFNAHLCSDKGGRRFVIQYFLEDDTIAIREPPVDNSGVMGGKFLRRQVIKKPDGSPYSAADMYVGNVVDILCHQFELGTADEFTYRLMENNRNTFPYSDISKIKNILQPHEADIRKYFIAEHLASGKIDLSEMEKCFKWVGLELNKQQLLSLWRKLNKKNKEKISFTKIVKMFVDDSMQQMVLA